MCDSKELKQQLLKLLEDRKEIKKINKKHFESVLSLFNESKKIIRRNSENSAGNNSKLNDYENPCKTESVPDKNEIIITAVSNDLSEEPRIIAEKIFESIGMEKPKIRNHENNNSR